MSFAYEQFRAGNGPTLGVELELQIVDAEGLALRDEADRLVGAVPEAIRDSVRHEFHACCVEVSSGVGDDVAEVGRDLDAKLWAIDGAARSQGLRLAWGGTHPFSPWQDRAVTPQPRYRALAEYYGETIRRQLTFGLHVHVGVPSGDAAVRACSGLLGHLPALLALSANSPFWCGRATGLRSQRSELLSAAPIGGPPPDLADWRDQVALVRRLQATGAIESPKDLWWDVRPSPALGTVEVRVCDMPPDLRSTLALTALIQCLVHALARGPRRTSAGDRDEAGALIVRQDRWRAARFGLDAELFDPESGRKRPARRLLRDTVRRLRGVARELGCADELAAAGSMAAGPTAADRQLALFERTGDLTQVVRRAMLPEEGSMPPPAASCSAPSPVAAGLSSPIGWVGNDLGIEASSPASAAGPGPSARGLARRMLASRHRESSGPTRGREAGRL